MSDYKRFVSYIYGYKQGEKGENTGFVKVNARGGECKIWVHVRGFYTHHQKPYRVYAFKQKKEGLEGQYLGELESRNGALEWNGVTKTDSLMGGFSLEESRGIYIEGDNRVYAAEWDDYPVDVERFAARDRINGSAKPSVREQQLTEKPKNREKEKAPSVNENNRADVSIADKPDIRLVVPSGEMEKPISLQVDLQTELDRRAAALYAADLPASVPDPELEELKQSGVCEPADASRTEAGEMAEASQAEPQPEKSFPIDPKKDQWIYLENHFPFMRYQDRNGGVISSIRLGPRDLNRVPRDKWELGNNSFLLHGFYQYKHLLLLRRETEDYIGYYLGVPGVYNEREQMLASMFGFEEFRLMKGQKTRDGSFGYWCRTLR